jgi:hypothetical protein
MSDDDDPRRNWRTWAKARYENYIPMSVVSEMGAYRFKEQGVTRKQIRGFLRSIKNDKSVKERRSYIHKSKNRLGYSQKARTSGFKYKYVERIDWEVEFEEEGSPE